MTYFLTALTNDEARLIVKEARVSNDESLAQRIIQIWEFEGYVVVVRSED